MWSGGQETNEHGESVLLLQPSIDTNSSSRRRTKSKSSAKTKSNNPSSSHIGGHPIYHQNDSIKSGLVVDCEEPKCTKCKKSMYLLLQLHAPLDKVDRTLYVFGCNNASCYNAEEDSNNSSEVSRFYSCLGSNASCGGGGGVIRCIRSQQTWKSDAKNVSSSDITPDEIANPKKDATKSASNNKLESNDWGIDDDNNDSDGGWGDDSDDDWGGGGEANNKGTDEGTNITMDDLESMLDQCEVKQANKMETDPKLQSPSKISTADNNTVIGESSSAKGINKSSPAFDQYQLDMFNEPTTGREGVDSDDEDDADNNGDVSKVDQMLSRYLDMEQDEEIISALKGGNNKGGASSSGGDNTGKGGGGGGGGGEKYERLPPEERAFQTFATRLKRSPGQVARYAYGGEPLWSIPLPSQQQQQQQSHRSKQQQKSKKNKKTQNVFCSPLPTVPKCVCGADRVFEFQVLPSLLHVLDVDSHATTASDSSIGDTDDMMDLISAGGMNWGAIAIYSCSVSCDESRDEFVIVQNAVGDAPIQQRSKGGADDSDDDMDGN